MVRFGEQVRLFGPCLFQQISRFNNLALQFCWEDLAEIRSLAVYPDHLGKNIGSKLTLAALTEARAFSIKKVFTLTYRPEFFKKLGFNQIDRADLPLKIWADCILCIKFPDCDEIAMMKEMDQV